MKEPVPLHRVHEAIFDFCRRWPDAVIFGAQAVNAHLPEAGARMTQDVDILGVHPEQTAGALAEALRSQLHIATCVREVVLSKGFRGYQKRESGPRHLADVRRLECDAEPVRRDGLVYVGLARLVAMKLAAATRRATTAQGPDRSGRPAPAALRSPRVVWRRPRGRCDCHGRGLGRSRRSRPRHVAGLALGGPGRCRPGVARGRRRGRRDVTLAIPARFITAAIEPIEIAVTPSAGRLSGTVEVAVGKAAIRCEPGVDAAYIAALVRAIANR